jgi:transposase
VEQKKHQYQLKRVIGLDVHPECFSAGAVQASLYRDLDPQILWVHNRVDMNDLEPWMRKNTEPNDLFILEAGSNSFETVARIESCDRKALVLESYRAGAIAKSYLKTDKEDAVKLAKIYLSGLAHEVWIPDDTTREYREIFASYKKAVKDNIRAKNRIWGWLNEHGIKNNKNISLLNDKGKKWIAGCRKWTYTQEEIIAVLLSDLEYTNNKRNKLVKLISAEVSTNKDMLKLLRLFGINKITAFALKAIIGNVTRFRNPKKLVAYLGLQPKVNESGKHSYSGSIAHFGRKDVRSMLVECAHSILRTGSKDNSFAKCGRALSLRKKGNIAVIALARKLVVAAWYLLRGFFTPLTEADETLKVKFTKLAVQVGKEWRNVWGYLTISDFVEDKIKLLQAGA